MRADASIGREELLTLPAPFLECLDHGAVKLAVSDFRDASQAGSDGIQEGPSVEVIELLGGSA
jgi:hypothetical protein